jgi:putative acetyltransferase
MKVTAATPDDYLAIVDLWEASVRATHTFLPEEDIRMFRPLILEEYLDAVALRCARTADDTITGFLGVADNKVEMLFIDPALMGRGIGRLLLDVAVSDLGATLVDVNEQNPDAVGFYLHYGFELVSRDPLDGLGKPYPILHLALPEGRA